MSRGEQVGLLRGTGADLGPYALAYPREERSLLRVLRDQAERRPDAPWLTFDLTDTLTFGQAHRRTNRIGNALRAAVGEGAHVGLFMRNQRDFMPAFYGAMANGGVTVPLNPDARGPLLRHVVEKSRAQAIIARTDLLEVLERLDDLCEVQLIVTVGDGDRPDHVHGVPVVDMDDWLADHPDTPPQDIPAHHEMALLQFTSGTTGHQKGAIYSHHWLHLFAAMITDSSERTPDDVLVTPLPLCHVAALHLVANSALHAGCHAHMFSRFSASEFWNQAAETGANWGIILGPMAAMILKVVPEAPPHKLRHLFCVPPPPERVAFEERYGTTMLWQGYGSTEVFTHPMPLEMIPDVPEDTLGPPVRFCEFGVVDEHDNLLPPDTVGELVIRPLIPHGMIDGYYDEPEATVQAFRNFMFHTGDLATYDDRGLVHYRGRKVERIRSRGEMVSAVEVEYVALRHPQVLEAAVYGVPSELGEEDVKLDVVLREHLDPADLHAWLTENLPRFMVPRYLEVRDAFPKTPSERIQKWRLKDEPLDRPAVFDAGERRARAS
jgi:carnitine-CoA ligase